MAVTTSGATSAATLAAATTEREKTLQQQLALPILLTDRILKLLQDTESTRSDFSQLTRQLDRLSHMLRTAVRLTSPPSPSSVFDRPVRRIATDVTKNLEKTLTLVRKCKHSSGLLRHVFLLITTSTTDFKKVSNLLESSIADLRWLLSLFESDDDDQGANLTIPPIASNDPIFAWVWSSIASLHVHRQLKDRIESANYLATLARDNDRYRKVIVEEGAVPPLLRLLKDGGGSPEGQISAANALCCLADEQERTRVFASELGIGVIVQVLSDSPMRVQVVVADLVARVSKVDPTAREEFGRANVLKPLMSCLVMHLQLEEYKRVYSGGKTSIHSIVQKELVAKNYQNQGSNGSCNGSSHSYHKVNSSSSFSGQKERENESSELKHKLKINCALAVWRLCEDSTLNSSKIAEPKGLFILSKLIETERGELQLNCLMAIMEVAKVAESNADLRKIAWKPNSSPAKAVLGQLLRVIKDEKDPNFQIPAIKAIGCLARIFPTKETSVVSTLVAQIGNMNVHVATEAVIALTKFACPENHNCVVHSRSIIEFNGVPPLMKLLSANDRAKKHGLVLLCYLSMHVGNSKELAEARALRILESAVHSGMGYNSELKELLSRAMHHLVLYQDADHPLSHSFAIV